MNRQTGLLKRYAVFLAGVIINSFGIALITRAALGTSPISSVPYVLSLQFPPTLGEFTLVVNMVFILLQVLLLRRAFQLVQLLQIAVNFIFSFFIDISMSLLGWLNIGNYVFQLLALVLGCAVLAFGIHLEVAPKVLMVPGEGAVYAIAKVLHKEFGTIKVVFDITLMSTAAVLSLAFFGQLNGVREGTVISAVLVGLIVKFFQRHLGFIGRMFGEKGDGSSAA